MFPFLKSSDGNCQDASILVEDLAVADKLLGACEGTANGNLYNYLYSFISPCDNKNNILLTKKCIEKRLIKGKTYIK